MTPTPPTGSNPPPGQAGPSARLQAALRSDGARPLVTFYDDATGERVELSVVTFENWVAKTANLLVDGLGLGGGERVALLLPSHWQTAVWLAACWRAGVTPVLGTDTGEGADVAVCGPDTLEAALAADEVVALSLRPLGGRFATALPAGVLDYAVEVPGHGDRFVRRHGSAEVLEYDGTVLTGEAVLDRAAECARTWGLAPGGRLLSGLTPDTLDGVLALLPAALTSEGSVVLVRHGDPAREQQRAAAEKVTAIAR